MTKQIEEYETAYAAADASKSDFADDLKASMERLVKQRAKQRDRIKNRLKDMGNESGKDIDGIDFESLGIDQVFVDEAHRFKNMAFPTKMSRIAGVPNGGSLRAYDLLMKSEYLDSRTPGRGFTFATGTAITNSLAEMYTMMRYLAPRELRKMGLSHFDNWAGMFGRVVEELELKPSGKGLRSKDRFSRFVNVAELVTLFHSFADVRGAEAVKLKNVPKIKGGKPTAVLSKMSDLGKQFQDDLVRRYEEIISGNPRKRMNKKGDETEDIVLNVCHEGRLLALDERLVSANGQDRPDSKLNALVEKVKCVYDEHEAIRGTQLVFSDLGVNPTDWGFSLYAEIVDKLAASGIPREEIGIMGDATNDAQIEAMKEKVRNGEIRVLLGSTEKMGMGMNVQDRLVGLHHLDALWRPADMEQRDGRGIRQRTKGMPEIKEVEIVRYLTEGSFDAYMWQTLERKAKFIQQVMRGDCTLREMEEVGGEAVFSYAEMKAMASGNPAILTLAHLEMDLKLLEVKHRAHRTERINMQTDIRNMESRRKADMEDLSVRRADFAAGRFKDIRGDKFSIKVGDAVFEGKAKGKRSQTARQRAFIPLLQAIQAADMKVKAPGMEVKVGEIAGFDIVVARQGQNNRVFFKGVGMYKVSNHSPGAKELDWSAIIQSTLGTEMDADYLDFLERRIARYDEQIPEIEALLEVRSPLERYVAQLRPLRVELESLLSQIDAPPAVDIQSSEKKRVTFKDGAPIRRPHKDVVAHLGIERDAFEEIKGDLVRERIEARIAVICDRYKEIMTEVEAGEIKVNVRPHEELPPDPALDDDAAPEVEEAERAEARDHGEDHGGAGVEPGQLDPTLAVLEGLSIGGNELGESVRPDGQGHQPRPTRRPSSTSAAPGAASGSSRPQGERQPVRSTERPSAPRSPSLPRPSRPSTAGAVAAARGVGTSTTTRQGGPRGQLGLFDAPMAQDQPPVKAPIGYHEFLDYLEDKGWAIDRSHLNYPVATSPGGMFIKVRLGEIYVADRIRLIAEDFSSCDALLGEVVRRWQQQFPESAQGRAIAGHSGEKLTFQQGKQQLWAHLDELGWTMSEGGLVGRFALKRPWAESPDGYRLTFRPQSIYFNEHSLHVDVRVMTPEQVVAKADGWMKDSQVEGPSRNRLERDTFLLGTALYMLKHEPDSLVGSALREWHEQVLAAGEAVAMQRMSAIGAKVGAMKMVSSRLQASDYYRTAEYKKSVDGDEMIRLNRSIIKRFFEELPADWNEHDEREVLTRITEDVLGRPPLRSLFGSALTVSRKLERDQEWSQLIELWQAEAGREHGGPAEAVESAEPAEPFDQYESVGFMLGLMNYIYTHKNLGDNREHLLPVGLAVACEMERNGYAPTVAMRIVKERAIRGSDVRINPSKAPKVLQSAHRLLLTCGRTRSPEERIVAMRMAMEKEGMLSMDDSASIAAEARGVYRELIQGERSALGRMLASLTTAWNLEAGDKGLVEAVADVVAAPPLAPPPSEEDQAFDLGEELDALFARERVELDDGRFEDEDPAVEAAVATPLTAAHGEGDHEVDLDEEFDALFAQDRVELDGGRFEEQEPADLRSHLLAHVAPICEVLRGNERVTGQIAANGPTTALLGDFPGALMDAVEGLSSLEQLVEYMTLAEQGRLDWFKELVMERLRAGLELADSTPIAAGSMSMSEVDIEVQEDAPVAQSTTPGDELQLPAAGYDPTSDATSPRSPSRPGRSSTPASGENPLPTIQEVTAHVRNAVFDPTTFAVSCIQALMAARPFDEMVEAVGQETGVVNPDRLASARGMYEALAASLGESPRGDVDGISRAVLKAHPALADMAAFSAASGMSGEGFVELLKFLKMVPLRTNRAEEIAEQFTAYASSEATLETRDRHDGVADRADGAVHFVSLLQSRAADSSKVPAVLVEAVDSRLDIDGMLDLLGKVTSVRPLNDDERREVAEGLAVMQAEHEKRVGAQPKETDGSFASRVSRAAKPPTQPWARNVQLRRSTGGRLSVADF